MTNSTVKRAANRDDILDYLKKNGCKRRKDILQYMTKDIEKEGVSTISSPTVSMWLTRLSDQGKLTHKHRDYCLAEPKSQDAGIMQDKEGRPTTGFLKTVEEKTYLAKSLQKTAFLLEAALLLLDKIRPSDDSHETIISEKEKCQACLASVKKIIDDEFEHLDVQRENKYGVMVREAQESYNEKHCRGMPKEAYNIANFRDAFSDVILQIRQKCESMRSAPPTTDKENVVSDSCRLVSTALNKVCKYGYDLVVRSYEYDEELDMFKIDISDLKKPPYKISRLYLDGKKCMFNATVHEQEPGLPPCLDCTIEFYPNIETDENPEHILTIMVQCVEFSFRITCGQRRYEIGFLDRIGDDVAKIGPVWPQSESDRILLLTPQTGGEIQDIIESHRGKHFDCSSCGGTHLCNGWIGRPDDDGGGMSDGSGNRYVMAIKCDDTGRDVPLRHIRENIFERCPGD